jgi:hypothetical protein
MFSVIDPDATRPVPASVAKRPESETPPGDAITNPTSAVNVTSRVIRGLVSSRKSEAAERVTAVVAEAVG